MHVHELWYVFVYLKLYQELHLLIELAPKILDKSSKVCYTVGIVEFVKGVDLRDWIVP